MINAPHGILGWADITDIFFYKSKFKYWQKIHCILADIVGMYSRNALCA